MASTGDELAEDNVIWKSISAADGVPAKRAAAAATEATSAAGAAASSPRLRSMATDALDKGPRNATRGPSVPTSPDLRVEMSPLQNDGAVQSLNILETKEKIRIT